MDTFTLFFGGRRLAILVLSAGVAVAQTGVVVPPALPGKTLPVGAAAVRNRLPVLTWSVAPDFPPGVTLKGDSATVRVDFVVDSDGNVVGAYALAPADPELAKAAVAAVSQWSYEPGRKNGMDVSTHLIVPIVFAAPPSPDEAEQVRRAAKHTTAGEEAIGKGLSSVALSEFSLALAAHPSDAHAHWGKSRAYALTGNGELALDEANPGSSPQSGVGPIFWPIAGRFTRR